MKLSHPIALMGAIVLVLIVATISDYMNVDITLKLLTLLLGLSAIHKYAYEKDRARKTEIIDLISFFRKELLPESEVLHDKLRNYDIENLYMKMDFDDIILAEKHYPIEFETQTNLLAPLETIKVVTSMANAIEEFAVRVLTLDAEKENSIAILKNSFVQLTETISTYILKERKLTDNLNFTNTQKLYTLWR